LRVFLTRRLFTMILVWIGVSLLTFIIANVIPSDPVALRLGPKATHESITYWRHQLGLDLPLPQQYARFMGGLLHGDLGNSIWSGRPVVKDLADYLPATIELAFAALLLAAGLGIPLGVIAAARQGSWLDRSIQFLATFGLAMPLFWLGLIIQLLFYRSLGLLPLDSRIDLNLGPPARVTGMYILDSLLLWDLPRFQSSVIHLILPAITLALPALGGVARMTRASVLDAASQDFVRTARAKGAGNLRIMVRHILRNALLPVVTLLGSTVNALLAGAIVVESVFNWPGLGWYATRAILASDYSAIVSVTLIIAIICTVVNLLTDLLYKTLDPRIVLT
jgi:ABC-type dipeptide/oligopeptide/nickel transport system permease component